jgi:hypothetical protein
MALDMQLETYLKNRPTWVQEGRVGTWVVIHGSDVLGFYISFDAALEAGYDRYGINEVFMARQIAEAEHPIHTSRRAVHVPHPR